MREQAWSQTVVACSAKNHSTCLVIVTAFSIVQREKNKTINHYLDQTNKIRGPNEVKGDSGSK